MKIARKLLLSIVASLILSLCSCDNNKNMTESMNNESSNTEYAVSFEGEWNRTNIPKAFCGSINIKNQKNNFFNFDFKGNTGINSGIISGTAQIIDEFKAVFTYENKYSNKLAIVTFILDKGELKVSAENNSDLGFGMGVRIDGNYITSEPNYTNANLIDSVLPKDLDKENARKLLGENAYELMAEVMDMGVQYINDELNYSGYLQGAGVGIDIKINGGFYYILGHCLEKSGYTLYTNDPAFQSTLPDYFNISNDETLNFVYKKLT